LFQCKINKTTMKTIILVITSFLIYNSSNAQFTFNSYFNPVPGNVHRMYDVDTLNLNPGAPGTNQNWNFSSRSLLGDSTITYYVTPSSTPYAGYYPGATLASYEQSGLTYTYYITSSSIYEIIGLAASTGFYIFPGPEVLGQYPITYNQQFSADYRGVGYFTTDTVHLSGHEISIVDGYGTISLPSGTSSVMRVKSMNIHYDTIIQNGIPHSNGFTLDTSWRWFKSNYRFPIFEINDSWTSFGLYRSAHMVMNSATIGINEISSTVPESFSLSQNYPNPFNPTTKIRYAIRDNSFVSIKIFDVLGREISTLVNEKQAPGVYEVNFDADNFSSGVYFYKLETANFSDVKKMILQK